MQKRLLPVVLLLAVVAGIGVLAIRSTESEPSPGPLNSLVTQIAGDEIHGNDPDSIASAVNSLARVLDAEIAERRILSEQLEELQRQLSDLQENLGPRVTEALSRANNEAVSVSSRRVQEQDGEATLVTRLAAAGFTEKEAATLRRRQGEIQMQQVELDDRARREGWVNTPRYYQEISKLSNDMDPIRRELGDDAFDRYLFATGRPNRIRVGRVIETSPAEQAGLRPGDVIVSYAGERVFSTRQLTSLRSGGERGLPVSLEITRDGVPMQITLPRGPMGVQTQADLVNPVTPPPEG